VHSAKDEEHNNAIVLLELLEKPTKQVVMDISRIHGCIINKILDFK
jgi:hypothetical protein